MNNLRTVDAENQADRKILNVLHDPSFLRIFDLNEYSGDNE